ncbi:hypothetical protein GCM10010294_24900 [Streptomyces griseoloalbus]|uniref:hypothetical protein n=1 Tax=Streptomyces griseoloalbus TaxID=67303 RepID=UPI001873893E|nr:hypothetical protein GCM10010294_24900 [Streptomyces griseoloalbus]
MAFDVRGELAIGGTWVDATGELLKRQALVHRRGRQDQASRVDPSSLQPLLNNTTGQFSPDNPMGPYYGQFGRNTPFRLSVKAGTPALELDGTAANNASTPDTAALDITGDLDIRWEGEADWYASGAQMLIGKWGAAGNRSYNMRLQDGTLTLHVSSNGMTGPMASINLPALPRRAALRATVDIDNGAGGATFRVYWADSLDGPWSTAGDGITVAGTWAVFAGTAPLMIAPEQIDASVTRRAVTGRCYRAEVRNGIDGPVVANPDFRGLADGTRSFVDSAGRPWTVNGTAAVTNRRTRLMHELAAYPARWHPSGAHAWVEATTAGVLRRLRRGGSALQSTLRRRIPSGGPLAYWPMEDGASATRAASALDGGSPLKVAGLQFQTDSSLPSSEPLPVLSDAASLSGSVPGAVAGGWHVEMVYKLDRLPTTEQTLLSVQLSPGTGGVRQVRARVSATAIKVEALDGDDAVVAWFQHTGAGLGDFTGAWNRLQIFSSVSGSQARVNLAWRDVITGTWWYVFAPWTGTPGRVTGVRGSWGADFQGMAIGHLAAFDVGGTTAPAPGVTIYEGSDEAFAGETAGERMQRLAEEEAYPVTVHGRVSGMEQVGPQLPSPILDLLEEAADADGGILYEDRERLSLRYRGRGTMYNQPPALVLDYTQPGLAPPLEPTGDDDATENDVTVTRTNGSSGRAVLEEGPLSVQAPPDGVGPYPSQVTLNLYEDSQAEPQAYWRLHHGTYEGRRYPQVRVMVHTAPPELLDQILAVDIGDKMVIRNPPLWVAPGDIELIVQGYEETFASPYQWDIVFNCTPGSLWNVGVVEDPVYGRVDTDGSELAAAVDADDQLLPVRVTDGPAWIAAQPVLNANPDFAVDLTGWAGFGATIERVEAAGDAPFTGGWVMRLTPDGVSEFPNAGSEQIPVTVGATYVVSGWLRCARARSVALNVNWFDAVGYLATTANDQPVKANTWTWFEMTATAPAGAVTANVAPTVADFPPATDVLWAHRLTIRAAGGSPSDFPFDVTVGGEVATVTAVTDAASDVFGRTVASGWGAADTGQAWATSGGAASDFSVSGGYGRMSLGSLNVSRYALLPQPGADFDHAVSIATDALMSGGSAYPALAARYQDGDNVYLARLQFSAAGAVILSVRKRVASAETQLGTYTTGLTHAAGTFVRVRFQGEGTTLRVKAWLATAAEPSAWQISVTDTSLTAAGQIGIRSILSPDVTNVLPVVVLVDNYAITSPQTMHVVRSVNGVVKAHSAGADVRLAHPTRLAL